MTSRESGEESLGTRRVVEFVEAAGAFFKDLTRQSKDRIREYALFRLYLFYAIIKLIVNNWR